MTSVRSSPSGPLVSDLVELDDAIRVEGYQASAPLTLTLKPAGHAPGLYLLSLNIVARVAASTGTITRGYSYSAPGFGPATIAGFSATGITAAGNLGTNFTSITAYSSGESPITLTLTPAAVTGSPRLDVTAMASLFSD